MTDEARDTLEMLPEPVWSGVLKVGDIEMRCYVLADGQRLFNAEDVERLFTAPGTLTVEDFAGLAQWMKGQA